ncbi:hypothetical protein AUK10_02255 [Candidatus Gracilibacteria bacterium CG2_30_37_12]|nr:MAG: hypothetical protein AUK10_02255 [Candidatus Gracilibacteria bacterium CG2_30_37_12]
MDLKITDSSITLDSETGLYWLDIGQESAGFESIYYYMDGVERAFGNRIQRLFDNIGSFHFSQTSFFKKTSKVPTLRGSIIGISDFLDYSIVRWYSKRTNTWQTFFVQDGKISSFCVGDDEFVIFLYRDIYGKFHYATDFNDKNFTFSLQGNQLILKNILFDTEIYTWFISPKYRDMIVNSVNTLGNHAGIADIFIFPNLSYGNCHLLYRDFLKSLHLKRIPLTKDSFVVLKIEEETEDFFPVLKVGLYHFQGVGEEINLEDIRKLFLSYLPEYCLVSVIDNPEIEKWFSKIKRVSSLEIGSLDGLLETSATIGEYNKKGKKSWDNFLQIQYNYYILKTSLHKIDELLSTLPESDSQYELLRQRNLINKASIEAILPKYELFLSSFKSYKKEE